MPPDVQARAARSPKRYVILGVFIAHLWCSTPTYAQAPNTGGQPAVAPDPQAPPFLMISGAAGGAVAFLFNLKMGRIRANPFRKAALEIAGGLLVGFFIGLPFLPRLNGYGPFCVAFVLGLYWDKVVEYLHDKLLPKIGAVIGAIIRPLPHNESEGEIAKP